MMTWQTTWAVNKYWFMSRSQALYNRGRLLAKDNEWNADKEQEFAQLIMTADDLVPTKATLTTAYQHVWGYFKKICTPKEKATYLRLLATLTPANDDLGPFLKRLAIKYQVAYLLQSRLIQEI
ncbi:YbgA family protein [Levilactobacillus brevis]|uniref:YbgA family protein n=1 Tax=Levilactobacillus brevis TaxID=1580 RepID=UPI001BA81C69|nr:YbgA family protein [Levilactobacillus brevis]MBS0979074.1 YbgA family protein [Levilactobacillus brevis]